VGVIIYQQIDTELIIDTLLLSCRALGRGVEYKMIAHLGVIAFKRGVDRIVLKTIQQQRISQFVIFWI